MSAYMIQLHTIQLYFNNIRCRHIKQSHYRPWQALMIPGGWGSQISRQPAHESGKVVRPTHRPTLPQELFLVLTFVRGWVDPRIIVRPEGLCQWKIPVTPSGIEPATFLLVAASTYCATACPRFIYMRFIKWCNFSFNLWLIIGFSWCCCLP
jgi:hypothetical protein